VEPRAIPRGGLVEAVRLPDRCELLAQEMEQQMSDVVAAEA